jgi:hypothetical protein
MVVFMHLTYSFALLAQTEKVAPTQNQILPADFPKYVPTPATRNKTTKNTLPPNKHGLPLTQQCMKK